MKNSLKTLGIALSVIFLIGTSPSFSKEPNKQKIVFDIEGHRGARGLLPENTIPAFIKALELGVTTLELDTIISKDKKIVVSHDPFISSDICSFPNGKPLTEKDKLNMFEMNYSEISKFDCGSRGNSRFPKQKKMKTNKALLSQIVKETESYISKNKLPLVQYNIETKSLPEGDGKFNPKPEEFVNLLYNELKTLNILDRTIIQSFDVRTLQVLKKLDPKVKTALLVENKESFFANLKKLGFNPDIYSPFYEFVTPEMIKELHGKNIKIIPWTVNTLEEMKKLKKMGVDGIITDYPNIGVELIKK